MCQEEHNGCEGTSGHSIVALASLALLFTPSALLKKPLEYTPKALYQGLFPYLTTSFT